MGIQVHWLPAIVTTRVASWTLCAVALAAMAVTPPSASAKAVAGSLPCSTARCGLHADGPYPNYVIGRLAHVGTEADMAQVMAWAKSHGYWQSLPSALSTYLQDVALVTIRLPSAMARHPVTVFVTRQEADLASYRVGDLVRYSPHGDDHEIPPKKDAADAALFHGLTGCVALLCRRGDRACVKRYRQGVFTKAQGRQVDLRTGRLLAGGLRIDPVSLLPVN